MQSAAAEPSSLTETLEHGKIFYQHEDYESARLQFEAGVGHAWPAQPLIWIEAMFCLADCDRLLGDFTMGARRLTTLLQRVQGAAIPTGRFQRSCRMAVIQSFLVLVEIGRRSLRTHTAALNDLLLSGNEWARREVGAVSADTSFQFAQLLLARNYRDALEVAREMEEIAGTVERQKPDVCTTDPLLARYRACETFLDAGVLRMPPRQAPQEHWAHHWTGLMHQILAGRLALLQHDLPRARQAIAAIDPADHRLRWYRDVAFCRAAVEAQAAGEKTPGAGASVRLLIHAAIAPAQRSAGDLALPLWTLLEMINHQLTRVETRGFQLFRRRGSPVASPRLADDVRWLASILVASDWLRSTLVSRGLTETGFNDLLRWAHASDPSGSWQTDGTEYVRLLRKAIRP